MTPPTRRSLDDLPPRRVRIALRLLRYLRDGPEFTRVPVRRAEFNQGMLDLSYAGLIEIFQTDHPDRITYRWTIPVHTQGRLFNE